MLLETKFRPPDPRAGWIERQGLIRRLADSRAKLGLITAPVGYGKTVLAAQWHSSSVENRSFAWVSLDPGDNDPVRLWSHITRALQRVSPRQALAGALEAIEPVTPDIAGAFLPVLANELTRISAPRVLLLDGYDSITEAACHEQIAFLLGHTHQSLQLALTTRAEPALPLSRIRAAGEITEIGPTDLRLTADEARAVVQDMAKIRLRERDVARLLDQTEGWPAGIYLAALSLRDHLAGTAFNRLGGDRYITDFLIEEVLTTQPGPVRRFLERTSILSQLTAPLCEAVAEPGNADEIIDTLEHDNLFIVPLDSERLWFRHHRLFREVLLRQLTRNEPELVPILHARASVWHQQSGSPDEAVGHALAAGDVTRTLDLITARWSVYAGADRITGVAEWLSRLGRAPVAASPAAAHCAAWLAALSGRHGSARRWLALAETSRQHGPPPEGAVSLELSAALLRGIFAFDGLQTARESAAKAAALANDPASGRHATALAAYGWNLYLSGEDEPARRVLRDVLLAEARVPFADILALTTMCLMAADDGLTAQADSLARDAGQRLTGVIGRKPPGAALAHLAAGSVHASQGRAANARDQLELALSVHSRRKWHNPWVTVEIQLRLARVLLDLSEVSTAKGLLSDIAYALRALPDGTNALQARLARLERRCAGESHTQTPAELLSERELAVLRLLPSSLSRREIGKELDLSVNTIKTYTRVIYGKLGASSREDAVARASDLGLISRHAGQISSS